MKSKGKNKIIAIAIFGTLVTGFITMSFIKIQQDDRKPWVVPDASKKVKNPVKSDAESMAAGKTTYNKHCKSCHGTKGMGDGPKSKELKTPCGDFTTKEFQDQTDGEIFYKAKEGREDMPSFKKKITDDEEIWQVVNFVRSLGESKKN